MLSQFVNNSVNLIVSISQVSNQCMALVRDDCLVPTEAPELLYVRKSSSEQYIPDVFYKVRASMSPFL